MQYNVPEHIKGLTTEELKTSRKKFGFNQIDAIKKNAWYRMLLDILKEPMLLLLIAVTVII